MILKTCAEKPGFFLFLIIMIGPEDLSGLKKNRRAPVFFVNMVWEVYLSCNFSKISFAS